MGSIVSDFLPTFLLGFSSLFPLINPVGTALIIQPYFSDLDIDRPERPCAQRKR